MPPPDLAAPGTQGRLSTTQRGTQRWGGEPDHLLRLGCWPPSPHAWPTWPGSRRGPQFLFQVARVMVGGEEAWLCLAVLGPRRVRGCLQILGEGRSTEQGKLGPSKPGARDWDSLSETTVVSGQEGSAPGVGSSG